MWTNILRGLGFCSIPFGSIYLTYGIVDNLEILNFEGSTSAKVLIESLYSDKNITFSPIGSNAALKRVMSSLSKFALVSHNLEETKKENSWSSANLEDLTLAKEPILVVYKPPKNCNKNLVLDKENIKHIYSVFSGSIFEDLKSNLKLNLKDLILDDGNCSVNLIPWVKNVGPSKSGIAKSFMDNPLLKTECKEQKCTKWLNEIKEGYGEDLNLNYTLESNLLHWESFSSNLKDGFITYFPGSFVFANWDFFQSFGLKIASFKDTKETNLNPNNYSIESSNYSWNREFHLVYPKTDTSITEMKSKLQNVTSNLKLIYVPENTKN